MSYIRRPKPVIKIYRGDEPSIWRWLGPLVVAALILAAVAGYLFLAPLIAQRGVLGVTVAEVQQMRDTIGDLKAKNRELRERLAIATRSSEIDSNAGKELMATLAIREKALLDLREELNFYKSMVTSKGERGASSVSIRSFTIAAGAEKDTFSYKLVLARVDGKGKAVKGKVELRVQGRKGEESQILDWEEISLKKGKKPGFKFQFFQRLEGELSLPTGFEPENILVKVVPDGKKQQSVQQSFSWNSVNKGSEENAGKEED